MCSTRSRSFRGKTGHLGQFVGHEPQSDLHVAQQLAFRGVAERALVTEFADLADVVQHHTGHQQIAVDPWVVQGHEVGQTAKREHVLQQPAEEGVVDALCRGRATVGLGDRVIPQDRLQQPAQMGIADAADDGAQFILHLQGVTLGSRQEVGKVHFPIVDTLQAVDGELHAVVIQAHLAAHAYEVILAKRVGHFLHVVPHLGVYFAGLVHQHERQVRVACSLLLDVLALHEEDPVGLLARGQIGDCGSFHGTAQTIRGVHRQIAVYSQPTPICCCSCRFRSFSFRGSES